jgi:plasmid stabilization system protein ParE
MKRYAVTITKPALKDLEDIYSFHAAWNEERAERLYDEITNGILTLETMPLRYGVPQFEPCIANELHRMLVDKYSVFYLVEEDRVTVTDILYSSADLEARLTERAAES